LQRADFVTLHTPLTDETRNILSRERLEPAKPGIRIVNCARGGLIDEAALKDLLESGQVAGAALDVFARNRRRQGSIRCSARRLHLHPASWREHHRGAGQCRAAGGRADGDYLVNGGVTNALNMPSLSAEEAPKLRPYMALAEKLGSLVGQLAHGNLTKISIEREGRGRRPQRQADHRRGAGRAS
jgi:D-3-phosphoglycerate dehydrogenase